MVSNFYISSLAFFGMHVEEIVAICKSQHYNLEFSSGMPFNKNMVEIYLDADIKKMPHNYFPDSKIPFVLNLASTNPVIRYKSIEHCKKGLNLAKASNSSFFAAHAGFCVDPKPTELGKKISINQEINKTVNKGFFLDSISQILQFADDLEIDFLIENNVLAPFNYNGINPLLCCSFDEINWLFEEIKHERFGLLLDTAHLKVSCTTLNLDLLSEFNKIRTYIKAFHHSDNNGKIDSNSKLDKNYWFLDYFNCFENYIHVLEVKSLSFSDIENQINLFIKNGN